MSIQYITCKILNIYNGSLIKAVSQLNNSLEVLAREHDIRSVKSQRNRELPRKSCHTVHQGWTSSEGSDVPPGLRAELTGHCESRRDAPGMVLNWGEGPTTPRRSGREEVPWAGEHAWLEQVKRLGSPCTEKPGAARPRALPVLYN